jgi:hypothetical protein
MTLLLLASALGLLALPGCARPLGRRLPPAEWAKLCVGLLLVGGVALEAGLVVVGGLIALRLAGMKAVADLRSCGGAPTRCVARWSAGRMKRRRLVPDGDARACVPLSSASSRPRPRPTSRRS